MPDAIIVTGRVAKRSTVVPGSIQFPCGKCGYPTWLAPSAQKQLSHTTGVICLDCAKADGLIRLDLAEEISDEQFNELEQTLGYRPTRLEMEERLRKFLST